MAEQIDPDARAPLDLRETDEHLQVWDLHSTAVFVTDCSMLLKRVRVLEKELAIMQRQLDDEREPEDPREMNQ